MTYVLGPAASDYIEKARKQYESENIQILTSTPSYSTDGKSVWVAASVRVKGNLRLESEQAAPQPVRWTLAVVWRDEGRSADEFESSTAPEISKGMLMLKEPATGNVIMINADAVRFVRIKSYK